jgi:hypothetical protein
MANLSQEIEQILRSRLKEQDIDLDIDIDISDEMKQSTITDIADTVINSVKEAVLADPRVASRMDRLRVSAAGQMEAVKAHLDRTRDEMVGLLQRTKALGTIKLTLSKLEDTVVAAKRDMAAIVKEVIQKIVRESVKISFTVYHCPHTLLFYG